MDACDEYIDSITKDLPELCSSDDLVKVGIFRSAQTAAYGRKHKYGPPYVKLPGRCIRYPKKGVISYLISNKFENSGVGRHPS